jgi:hypothetical protein
MITITIAGGLLHTPEATIADCWDDRQSGLLSRPAGLALMPYLNEQDRGDALVFRLIVDGDDAVIGYGVQREQDVLIGVSDELRTGRLYVTTADELLRRLGGAE